MSSVSAYSFLNFINGININASLDRERFVPIPDLIRSGLNAYWNDGKFIGAGAPANEEAYSQVILSTVNQVSPTSRIEKISLRPNVTSDRWSDKPATSSSGVRITEKVKIIRSALEQEAAQGNLVTGSTGQVGADIMNALKVF